MNYLPPFQRLKDHLTIRSAADGTVRVSGDYQGLLRLIQTLLIDLEVDEAWYLRRNQDVAEAIRAGTIQSARQHFRDHGYFEGRAPFPMPVDEAWYLANNADVAEQVRLGTFESGQAHFDIAGYRDGRLPRPM